MLRSLMAHEHGPFDIIGDVHGCYAELVQLLGRLGYQVASSNAGVDLASGPTYRHSEQRKAVFLGDLVDRGPGILDTLRLVHNMISAGSGFCVIGNHDDKLLRKLKGQNVKVTQGLEHTLAEIEALPLEEQSAFKRELQAFLAALPHHCILDDYRLVIAHAGLKQELHGNMSSESRAFALYGETTGQRDEYGLPIRGDWPAKYAGEPWVIYGHTPVPEPRWLNKTVGIDTGCIFGGKLTALRYPEMETVSVCAERVYYQSAKPFPRACPSD